MLVEAAPTLGGLASAWTLDTPDGPVTWDRFYHVVLGQDRRVIALLQRLGLADALHFTTVRSELLAGGRVHPMSSVLDLLRLPVLDLPSRVRVGATVALGAVLPVAGGDRTTSAPWLRRWSAAPGPPRPSGCRCCGPSSARRPNTPRPGSSARPSADCWSPGSGAGTATGSAGSRAATPTSRAPGDRLTTLGVDVRTGTAATAVRRG